MLLMLNVYNQVRIRSQAGGQLKYLREKPHPVKPNQYKHTNRDYVEYVDRNRFVHNLKWEGSVSATKGPEPITAWMRLWPISSLGRVKIRENAFQYLVSSII